MTIEEKTPRERAAMTFRAAGLGERSVVEAARLLFETGISFESAAVLGQRSGEACSATPATIQEAARRYRRSVRGARTTTAWGRQIQEAPPAVQGSTGPAVVEKSLAVEASRTSAVDKGTVLIDGVPYTRVDKYVPVGEAAAAAEPSPAHPVSAWGRPLTEQKEI